MFEFLVPLHPKIVHFPIALFITALIFESLGAALKKKELHQAALIVYVAAALLTPFVVWSGYEEAERLNLHHPILEKHEFLGFATMWVSLVSLPVLWFVHKKCLKIYRGLFLLLLIGMASLVILTGHFGGRMVYEYGIGIE